MKFRLGDPPAVRRRLEEIGTCFGTVIEQSDRYFSHPSRDFAATDEALRLRSVGDTVVVTWKGPRLPGGTKTRREIELPLGTLASGAAGVAPRTLERWTELLEALGFRRVLEVAKRRVPGRVVWHGVDVEIAIDAVADLGDFLEIERLAEPGEVASAQAEIESLAGRLGCGAAEPRSYLEMLLART